MPLLLAVMLHGNVRLHIGGFDVFTEWVALVIFLSAAITDLLDGYIARRRRQVTQIGKLLDPIADKLLISAAFISLVELGRVPAWMVVIIVGREFAVSGLRYVALAAGHTIAASEWGKAKMVAQVIAVSLLLLSSTLPEVALYGTIALWLVVFLSIVSMADYFRVFWSKTEQAEAPPKIIVPPEHREASSGLPSK